MISEVTAKPQTSTSMGNTRIHSLLKTINGDFGIIRRKPKFDLTQSRSAKAIFGI
jgi:hypothetical protein